MKFTHPWLLIGLLPLLACQPEGEEIYSLDDAGVVACADAEVALADGIQSGDELLLSFDCLNAGGQYDALLPTLEAMNTATDPDGNILLNVWIDVINQELTNAQGGSTTVALAPVDIASVVGDLLGFFESGAPLAAVNIGAEAIEYDVVDNLLRMGGHIAYNTALLGQVPGTPSLNKWLGAAQDFVCKDYEEGEACRSNLARALYGMAANASSTDFDPNDPANDDLRVALSYILYANGDVVEATKAADSFAKALSKLGSEDYAFGEQDDNMLVKTTQELLPQLYGDNINTPEYEGYPSHNPAQSALYGLMLTLRDKDVQDALEASADETYALASHYFNGSVSSRGNMEDYHTDTCLDLDEATELGGVANTGVDQLVRMLSASNVQYDATPTCEGLFNVLLPLAEPYVELSGTKSIAAIILEMAAALPLPVLQIGADMLNLPPTVILSNVLCGMNLQYDDTEVLQAAIYWDDMAALSLPMLKALNHAGQMENLANYLDSLWRVKGNVMCHMSPLLRHALDPNIPLDGSGGDIDAILPDPDAEPGSTYHDQVVEPMLTAMMDMAPEADVLMAPMALGLADSETALAEMLFNLGAMANQPTSALNDATLLFAELSQLGGEAEAHSVDLAPAADALNHEDLVYISMLTLGHPDVVEAMIAGNSETPISLIDTAGARLSDGTMSTMVAIFEAALRDLDQQLEDDGN